MKLEKQTIQKTKNKLFVAMVQDEDGSIQKVITSTNYDQLWLEVSIESKSSRGFWNIYNASGQFINGNFRPKISK